MAGPLARLNSANIIVYYHTKAVTVPVVEHASHKCLQLRDVRPWTGALPFCSASAECGQQKQGRRKPVRAMGRDPCSALFTHEPLAPTSPRKGLLCGCRRCQRSTSGWTEPVAVLGCRAHPARSNRTGVIALNHQFGADAQRQAVPLLVEKRGRDAKSCTPAPSEKLPMAKQDKTGQGYALAGLYKTLLQSSHLLPLLTVAVGVKGDVQLDS